MNLFKKSLKNEILELSKVIFQEILIENKDNSSLGIKNGIEIIIEYLNNNEQGLAFEHLKYLISVSEIKLTSEQINKMEFITSKLEIK
jgi:hypothetical protein